MSKSLIWLHEEALRDSHPVFLAAPPLTEAIFIWDNHYLQKLNYSLKRLVFIYETLCELSADIVVGDTVSVLTQLPANVIYVPATDNVEIKLMLTAIADKKDVIIVPDISFTAIKEMHEVKRFHAYWKKIEPFAFLLN